ncbi:MAG: hypothetical protein WC530_06360 [Candidatus Omnitrophota bacterium]|jgi:hypothetical protein
MRFAGPKLYFLSWLLEGVLLTPQIFAAEGKPWPGLLGSDPGSIKTRLAFLKKRQEKIIVKKDRILNELDRARIWVRRK